ncbi:MAG: c-type cytochrome [Anaerolineaceae bacterium]|nr:c-type cytochrome [Anaerolineaceae bacterium]
MHFPLNGIRSFFSAHLRSSLPAKIMIAAGFGLVFLFISTTGTNVQAEAPSIHLRAPLLQNADEGKAIFEEKCAGCHTIGGGKLVGPDLQGITQQRDTQWLTSFILNPAEMIASDAAAQQLFQEYNGITMPSMGLTSDQVAQVLAYLSNPGAASSSPTAPTTSAPAASGNPAVGKQLFTGELALTNGGPACIACHTVSGTGALGGGGLGPDLTHVFQRYGEAGLSGSLTTIAFPTMVGPFLNRPLTPEEKADLVAFFGEANQWQSPVPIVAAGTLTLHVILIFAIGLAITGVLFGLLWFIWIPLKKRYYPRLPVRKI